MKELLNEKVRSFAEYLMQKSDEVVCDEEIDTVFGVLLFCTYERTAENALDELNGAYHEVKTAEARNIIEIMENAIVNFN